jgi:hypothetical protein
MKALRFGISIPRLLLGKTLGRFTDLVVFGALSGLALEEVPDPPLPGPEGPAGRVDVWRLRLRYRRADLEDECGS